MRKIRIPMILYVRVILWVQLMMKPPSNDPRGIADHARTPAMLITRPNIVLGTIACRRLLVLMLKRKSSPPIHAHRIIPIQYQCVNASTSVSIPSSINAPSATVLNDQCLRSGPASNESTTIPILPAEYSNPTCVSLALNCTFAKSTSCVLTVVATKLTSAIISEMLRKTGCPST